MTLTASQYNMRTMRNKKAMLRAFKSERGCSRCSETNPVCLDFHHRNPDEKHRFLRGVPYRKSMFRGWQNMGYDAIVEEVAKCDILCANCHRKEEFPDPHGIPAYDEAPRAGRQDRHRFLEALRALP